MLTAYEDEEDESLAMGKDHQWADDQWAYLAEHLAIDAHKLSNKTECDTIENDTLPNTQVGEAAKEMPTLVKRTPQGQWETATAEEEEELRAHDEEAARLQALQRQHDEHVWDTMQKQKEEERKARAIREWDDWAMSSELGQTKTRPVKRFRLEVMVKDKDGNELATSTMEGDTEAEDSPQVVLNLHTELVPGTADPESPSPQGRMEDIEKEAAAKRGTTASDAETEVVQEPAHPVHEDLDTLEDILSSTLCREWFQWWSDNQIDDNMVVTKFGKKVLETFEINKAMIEMDESSKVDRELLHQNSQVEEAGMDDECSLARATSDGAGSHHGEGLVPTHGAGAASSSDSGGDSQAGRSDMNMENYAHAKPEAPQDDGEGVGWPGMVGDDRVRQWLCPKPAAAAMTVEEGEVMDVGAPTGDGVDSVEQQVLQDTQLDGLGGFGVDNDVEGVAAGDGMQFVEGDRRSSSSSTEGLSASKQLDLKHWLL